MAGRARVVCALGIEQTLAWGSSYYLVAILAAPMATALTITAFAAVLRPPQPAAQW